MPLRILIVSLLFASIAQAQVKLGIDCLREDGFAILKGKRVGLVAHPASVDSTHARTVDLIRNAPGVTLVALYGPEHGIYGDIYAGEVIKDRDDPRTHLPVHSIYGKTRRPTTQMLKDINCLVFDLQDIGSRSYTFISSMKACMQSCAEHDVEMIVLDRPNPLGGNRIEGPLLTKPYESFIGYIYVPYLHGMTIGELAQLVQKTELPKYTKLHVVKMQGWKREMIWEDTGLSWVPTSPQIPHARSCAFYAATGFLGELGQLSNGCGYTLPFELVGTPWVKGDLLANALNTSWDAPDLSYQPAARGGAPMKIPASSPKGIYFRSLFYKPFFATFKDELCEGVQVDIDQRKVENLIEINFKFMEALGAPRLFDEAKKSQIRSWDITCGSDEPRKYLFEQRDLKPLFAKWRQGCEEFRTNRRPYLLYE